MELDLDLATELIRRTLILTLLLMTPILAAGLIVGVVVSLLQAVTQVQEQTLSFIPKIIVMFVAAVVTLPWMSGHLMEFARELFTVGPTP